MPVPQNPTPEETSEAVGRLLKRANERREAVTAAVKGEQSSKKLRGTPEETYAANVVSNASTNHYKELRDEVEKMKMDIDAKNALLNIIAASHEITLSCMRTFQFPTVPSPAAKIDSLQITHPGSKTDFAHVETRVAEYPEGHVCKFDHSKFKYVLFVQRNVEAVDIDSPADDDIMNEALRRFGTVSCAGRDCQSPRLSGWWVIFDLGDRQAEGVIFTCEGHWDKDDRTTLTYGSQVFMQRIP